jgi:hypothetical protein
LTEALTGHFRDHHGYLLAMMLGRIDALTAQIDQLTTRIEAAIAPFAPRVAQLDEIPGIGATGAQEIIAEIGVDMARFPTPGHLVSWAKFASTARQSAGKNKPGAAANGEPWSRSATPFSSSPTACYPTPPRGFSDLGPDWHDRIASLRRKTPAHHRTGTPLRQEGHPSGGDGAMTGMPAAGIARRARLGKG